VLSEREKADRRGYRYLRALAASAGGDTGKTVSGADLNVALGRDPGDFDAAAAAEMLNRAEYVDVDWGEQHRPPAGMRITKKGLTVLGGSGPLPSLPWPPGVSPPDE
jgi:hypothetical protein